MKLRYLQRCRIIDLEYLMSYSPSSLRRELDFCIERIQKALCDESLAPKIEQLLNLNIPLK